MKIFLDTANVDEIKQASELGLVDGVTTNPSLIAKETAAFKEVLIEICELAYNLVFCRGANRVLSDFDPHLIYQRHSLQRRAHPPSASHPGRDSA